ncbi:MAG: type II secretion system protein M [Aquincola sp.]|nr:type II secretion system protein M [Aquincola sp.]
MSAAGTTSAGSAAGEGLRAALAPLRARWQALGARERRLVTVMAWVLGLTLLWLVAVAPAWRIVAGAPARLDELDAQLLQMQRLAGEVRTLRGAPAVGGVQAQAAVKGATDALGGAARLTLGGDRATVVFTNASGTQLREWLAEVRGAGRARAVEANLTRGPQGYSGTVVLALSGSNP